jgi:hypothetical protein
MWEHTMHAGVLWAAARHAFSSIRERVMRAALCVGDRRKRGGFAWSGKQKKVRWFGVDREKDAPHPFAQAAGEISRTGAFLRTIL